MVVGGNAKKQIDASGGREGGRGMATAGVVLGWVSVAITALWILAVFAIFMLGESASVRFQTVGSAVGGA